MVWRVPRPNAHAPTDTGPPMAPPPTHRPVKVGLPRPCRGPTPAHWARRSGAPPPPPPLPPAAAQEGLVRHREAQHLLRPAALQRHEGLRRGDTERDEAQGRGLIADRERRERPGPAPLPCGALTRAQEQQHRQRAWLWAQQEKGWAVLVREEAEGRRALGAAAVAARWQRLQQRQRCACDALRAEEAEAFAELLMNFSEALSAPPSGQWQRFTEALMAPRTAVCCGEQRGRALIVGDAERGLRRLKADFGDGVRAVVQKRAEVCDPDASASDLPR